MKGAAANQEPSLLVVEGLNVDMSTPSGELHAVRSVDFSVKHRETFCLVGESGCGKTMTSLALMRLLPSNARLTASRMQFGDRDLLTIGTREMAALRGSRLGMIFQDPMTSLNPVYTIGDQLEEIYLRHRSVTRQEARGRAEYLLQRVGIMSPALRLRQFPHQLSGGLRQRVMIAMALMCEPHLIIADEPTTALDVTVQVQILRILEDLQQEFGMAIILITHNLGIVARMADQLAVMYAGEIIETGTPQEVFENPQHPYTQGLLRCAPNFGLKDKRHRLGAIPGLVPSLINEIQGCSFRNRCDFVTPECANGHVPLRRLSPERAYLCHREPDPVAHMVPERGAQ